MRIIEDTTLVECVGEDWSKVRSPGRAARRRDAVSHRGRRKRSHRQNITPLYKPKPDAFMIGDTMVMHPETARLLRIAMERKKDEFGDAVDRQLYGALFNVYGGWPPSIYAKDGV